MAFLRLGALALTISVASAFRDTSPFFMFSTSKFDTTELESSKIAQSASVNAHVLRIFRECPSEIVVIVSQPGVSATDYAGRVSTPHLRRWLGTECDSVASSLTIPDVAGTVAVDATIDWVAKQCQATVTEVDAASGVISLDETSPRIIRVVFPELPYEVKDRASKLLEHDSFLNAVIASLEDQQYTVVYTTTPPSSDYFLAPSHSAPAPTFEMDDPFPSAMHMDLKRDLSGHARDKMDSSLPLFEKYQFLSPGIFMGLLVSFFLFSILYVGISAVAGLEVSYYAFSKEMGPTAQRKQQ